MLRAAEDHVDYIRDFNAGSSATAGGTGGLIKTSSGTLTIPGGLFINTNGNALGESSSLPLGWLWESGEYIGTLLGTYDVSGSVLDLSFAGTDVVSVLTSIPGGVWST